MKKIQVLYPDPQMEQLRQVAKELDRPISEIIREATAEWMKRWAPAGDGEVREEPPVFSGGRIKTKAEHLRSASHAHE